MITMKPELALALIMKRWRDWQKVVHQQLPAQQQAERLNFIRLYKLYKKMKENESKADQKNLFNKRPAHPGMGEIPVKKIKIDVDDYPLVICKEQIPPEKYFDYIRMDAETFFELFRLIEPKIKRQVWAKIPIPPYLRLHICLRYLASGNSMHMIAYEFEIAATTVAKIVNDTCQVIYDVMKDLVFPTPTKDMWQERAEEFRSQLQFPNCVGAIGGKQLVFQTPFYAESKGGKERGSLAFFAIVDINYCFSLLKVGQTSMKGKYIVFSDSQIGRDLQSNAYDFPPPSKPSEGSPELPYVLVGSQNFPLKNNVLQPYADSKTMDLTKYVFNHKAVNVARCAKIAFDVLTSQWKLFQKRISTNSGNTTKIVQAIGCLHNFLMNKEMEKSLQDKKYAVIIEKDVINEYLQGCTDVLLQPEEPSDEAVSTKEKFKQHLCQTQTLTLLDLRSK